MSAEQATEVAQVLAVLVADARAFPDQAAHDLRRLLAHDLAAIPRGARRWDRLAFLVALIRERDGLIPSAGDYDQQRRAREPNAPSASSLAGAYGHWLAAVRAAVHLLGGERVASGDRRSWRHGAYALSEVAAALARFERAFGTWPTGWEYEEWAHQSRLAAVKCGAANPRLPGTKQVRTAYGTFDRAIEAARRVYRPEELDDCGDGS